MRDNTSNIDTAEDICIRERYRRAEVLENATYDKDQELVLNSQVYTRWIGDSDCFWYSRSSRRNGDTASGLATEYRLVNATSATNTSAFDHTALAALLAQAVDQPVDPQSLPISNLEFDTTCRQLCFDAFEQRWQFDGDLKPVASLKPNPYSWLVSPDGAKAVFSKDHNIWLRDLKSGSERPLTTDGERYNAYGVQPESRDLVGDLLGKKCPSRLEAIWSPDSSQIFTMQTDERQVRSLPFMLHAPQDGTVAPRGIERKCALSGDEHTARFRLLVIDANTGSSTAAGYSCLGDSFAWMCLFSGNAAWWSGDSSQAFFVDMTRGQKTARLIKMDAKTGECVKLFEESQSTYLELGPDVEHAAMLVSLPDTNELIWSSERSGWRHLYLYDLQSGELKTPITTGDWLVRNILHVDAPNREVLVQLAGRVEGRNPYYRELARFNIDTGEMTLLISSDHDYRIFTDPNTGISATGNYVLTTRMRVDEAAVVELRDRNGEIVLIVETADTSGLPAGWQWPKTVSMKADDGITDIYGVMFYPSDFDPKKKYPVLDWGAIAPFYSNFPTGAFVTGGPTAGGSADPRCNHRYAYSASLAELGFIVTAIDGRGTAFRSKAFHDFGYGSFMDTGGLVDHVAGIKQLGERYPYMDVDNVGIVTTDGPGNGAVFGLLNYPDFYKVGTAFSLWDPYLVRYGEVYCGVIDNTGEQPAVWQEAAKRLEGKLLLVSGLLDPYFNSSVTFQLIDAVVKANKDIDTSIHPNGGHGLRVRNANRRVMDYFVQHLLGIEPPKNYKLVTSSEKAYSFVYPEKIVD